MIRNVILVLAILCGSAAVVRNWDNPPAVLVNGVLIGACSVFLYVSIKLGKFL